MRRSGPILGYMGRRKKITAKERHFLPLLLEPYRAEKGWTQEELAEKLGTSGVSIGRYEGGTQNWSVEFLLKAAKVLEKPWFDLLPLEGDLARLRELARRLDRDK